MLAMGPLYRGGLFREVIYWIEEVSGRGNKVPSPLRELWIHLCHTHSISIPQTMQTERDDNSRRQQGLWKQMEEMKREYSQRGQVSSLLIASSNRNVCMTCAVDFSCIEKSVGSAWFVCAIGFLWHAQSIRFQQISQLN